MSSAQHDQSTPLMQQYHEIKAQYPDTLLLFQVGDFYELFFDEAKTVATTLGIALTARGKHKGEPVPLCGVPVHALNHYVTRLVKAGFRVALCDQLENAVAGKMVRRGVTRVFTPGTLTDSALLDEKSSSYLLSFFPTDNGAWGFIFSELLTAQLFVTVVREPSEKILETELSRFFPDEVVLPRNASATRFASLFKKFGYFTSFSMVVAEHEAYAAAWLESRLSTAHRALFHESRELMWALYSLYAYLSKNQAQALEQAWVVNAYQPDDFLQLDAATQKNLELVQSTTGNKAHTLFAAVDKALTPMGSRMIKRWLMRPLIKQPAIEQRYDALAALTANIVHFNDIQESLRQFGDVERIIGRIALERAQLADYVALAHALAQLPVLVQRLSRIPSTPLVHAIAQHLMGFDAVTRLLIRACNRDIHKDWIIAAGFDEHLDVLRDLVENSTQKMVTLEKQEQQRTGINGLKIGYNSVHGYYFEVTKTHAHLMPSDFTRYQTLVGKERFVNAALQQLYHEITLARSQVDEVERAVFDRVKQQVRAHVVPLRRMAYALAHLDALVGFADISYCHGYVRPSITHDRTVTIVAGRHPVVEQVLGNRFIPNDTTMHDNASLWIITGPNMGGKSTYLRQVALIAILAQAGCYVPAQSAQLPLFDRIFTRIGAGDDLAQGKSTFLVEMEETAAICTHATKNSLIILDEVGRGTSTHDGLAIAQAVIEYLFVTIRARCLFATHYHELAHLEIAFPGIVNYHAASQQSAQGMLFLYKMVRGVADGSFGIQVAHLAHLPVGIIQRARVLVQALNAKNVNIEDNQQAYHLIISNSHSGDDGLNQLRAQAAQLEAIMAVLRTVDGDNLTPRQAFDLIWQLKQLT